MLHEVHSLNSSHCSLAVPLAEYLRLRDWQILHTNPQNKTEGCFGFDKFISEYLQETAVARTEAELLFMGLQAANLENGICLELGTYLGRSTRVISAFLSALAPPMKLFTVDSFEGLPVDWREGYPKGMFTLSEDKRPQLPGNCVQLIGQFSEVLPAFDRHLKQLGEQTPTPVVFLHVDCDIYLSTRDALQALHEQGRLVAGTVIVFDEYGNYNGWENGEHKAFMEFLAYSKFTPRWLARNINHQGVAVQLTFP
ncbi:MAG: class I SAM-dependent methyltransferase [Crinalium sp.]